MTEPTVTDRDVYLTRAFDAPVAVVWRFWTSAEGIAEWFGPVGYHVPVESVTVEPVVGGAWNLAMQSDVTDHCARIDGRIVEIIEHELLVVDPGAQTDGLGDLEHVTLRVQFHDHGERTRITLHQGPFTAEQRTATAAGWEESFAKIDARLTGGVR